MPLALLQLIGFREISQQVMEDGEKLLVNVHITFL